MKENTNQVEQPFILKYQESKEQIAQAINYALQQNNIPCNLVETILSDMLHQLRLASQAELNNAQKHYETALQVQKAADCAIKPTNESEG